jgi:primosomal protein N' (replication factor Y)
MASDPRVAAPSAKADAAPHVEVAVTLPVSQRYTYRVPPTLVRRAVIGSRVLVRFGAKKVTGVVVRERVEVPEGVTPVDLSEVLDDTPALPVDLVELCLWVSEYYEAPLGEVMRAALPAGSGESARSVVALTDAGRAIAEGEGAALPSKQRALLARLIAKPLAMASMKAPDKPVITALVTDGLVEIGEARDKVRVRLKTERIVQLAVPLAEAREAVSRAPKRYAVIDALAHGDWVPLEDLDKQVPGARSVARSLEKDGLLRLADRELPLEAVETGASLESLTKPPPQLTAEQQVAVDQIVTALLGAPTAASRNGAIESLEHEDPAVRLALREGTLSPPADAPAAPTTVTGGFAAFLLHGVTGSGKTEVYLRVIAEALEAGRNALVLVPEISLTPQLAARFRARFGDQVAILHSGLTEQQRLGEWSRLRRGEARIAVGARSAVFAPLAKLGVIVVDEEHDSSFKQDEGVRYHGRDVALVRAQRAGAVCVLGSATPSLETSAHAEKGQYTKLMLTERPTARPMPSVEIVDLKMYMPDGEAMLSAPLRTAIAETLAKGEQIILFLNRRGYATFVLCTACGHSFRCVHCSVSLTYHKHSDRLSCHYCNRLERIPDACPKCNTPGSIERKGLGTEKVAAAIAHEFPDARVARLDRDVATGAKVETVLSRVARREVDVLVGTQMVTKGHDFPGVTLVGVLCADTGLSLPDFRASERTFQLLAQVAGRAGRGDRPGRVLIQTYRPNEHAVVAAAAHDYAAFYAAEMKDREDVGLDGSVGYPPHSRIVLVRVDGANAHEVAGVAQRLAQHALALAERLGDPAPVIVRGPVPAPIEKLRGRTRWQVWLRAADRHALRRVARGLLSAETRTTVRVVLDVDPMSAM